MKFLDLFAGIGGFRLGMEQAGHECVGFCEIDKFARASYKATHNTEGETEFHDITAVTDSEWRELRGKVDIITGGFPCQSFSIAGKREGFADKTKGTLFFEIARAAKQIQPQLLFLENVKGLLNHDKGNTFRTILSTLDELGYDAEWQLLNSKDFGVPQNRERVFIIGHLRGSGGREVFPIEGSYGSINQNNIKTIGNIRKNGISQSGQVVSSNGLSPTLCASGLQKDPVKVLVREATKQGYAIAEAGDSINFEHPNSKTRRGRVGKGVANTLTISCNQGVIDLPSIASSRGRNPENTSDRTTGAPMKQRLEINTKGTSNTLTTVQKDNLVIIDDQGRLKKTYKQNKIVPTLRAQTHGNPPKLYDGIRIRKLTPRECWRLQGFPDCAFDKAQEVNSNSQLYKQAGNSVTVPVIYEIAKRFKFN